MPRLPGPTHSGPHPATSVRRLRSLPIGHADAPSVGEFFSLDVAFCPRDHEDEEADRRQWSHVVDAGSRLEFVSRVRVKADVIDGLQLEIGRVTVCSVRSFSLWVT